MTQQIETEQQLAWKSELQEILIDLSSRYINCSLDNIENEIQLSLDKVGRFINADRVYIFDYDYRSETTSNTFEWCNTGIGPEIENLQNVPFESIRVWMNRHEKGETIVISEVSALVGDLADMKAALEAQDIKSLITVPMMFEEKCLGFVGFDSVKKHREYTDDEIDLLKFYSQILANIHMKRLHELELQTARIKAEEANDAKNNFIAKISHELRNPLNGACGFMNLLEKTRLEKKQRMYLSNSTQSLGTAIKITNDLLDISKMETIC